MNHALTIIITLACVCSPVIQLPMQAIALPTKIALSKQQEINSTAKKITVRVLPEKSPKDGASGILIAQQKRTQGQQSVYLYLVLTNDHVVELLKRRVNALGGGYQVQTFDGQVHQAFLYQKANFRRNDLGLLWFSSVNNYELAHLGQSKSLKEYDQVFVAGFPSEKESGEEAFTVTFGHAATLFISGKPLDAGYQLGFSNQTSDGMSGGPVLDKAGRLVGVNGRGKNQEQIFLSGDPSVDNSNPYAYFNGKGEPSAETQRWMRHFAWGIPIETYTKLVPRKPFDGLQPQSLVADNQPTPSVSTSLLPNSSSSSANTDNLTPIIVIIAIFILLYFLIVVVEAWKQFRPIQSGKKSESEALTSENQPALPLTTQHSSDHTQLVAEVIVHNRHRTVEILVSGDRFLFAGKKCGRIIIDGDPKIVFSRKIPQNGQIIPITLNNKTYNFKQQTSNNSHEDKEHWDLYSVDTSNNEHETHRKQWLILNSWRGLVMNKSIRVEFTNDQSAINKG